MTEHESNEALDQPDEGLDRPDDYLLVVEGLRVHFPIRQGVFIDRTVGHVKAVDGVDLRIRRGSTTLGLVGESGCGKSTLGRGDPATVRADRGHGHPGRCGRDRTEG